MLSDLRCAPASSDCTECKERIGKIINCELKYQNMAKISINRADDKFLLPHFIALEFSTISIFCQEKTWPWTPLHRALPHRLCTSEHLSRSFLNPLDCSKLSRWPKLWLHLSRPWCCFLPFGQFLDSLTSPIMLSADQMS